jgi:microcystin-dependent protein
LVVNETPSHTHSVAAVANATLANNVFVPGSTVVLSQTTGKASNGSPLIVNLYASDTNPNQPMAPGAIGSTGGQPHTNMMPCLALNFCIALSGVYPTRS